MALALVATILLLLLAMVAGAAASPAGTSPAGAPATDSAIVQENDTAAPGADDPQPDLSLGTVSAPDRVVPGESFTVHLTASNDGLATGEVAVDLALEEGECSPASITASLYPSETDHLRATCTIDGDTGASGSNVTLTATAAGTNRTETITVTEPSLDVELGELETPYEPDPAGLTVPYVASNPTDDTVTDEVEFLADGEVVGSETVTLEPGETRSDDPWFDEEYELGGTIELGVATDASRDERTLNVTRIDPWTKCIDGVCGERVRDTTADPYGAIVNVQTETSGGASGALVEPGVVVTAAHVVSDGPIFGDDEPIPAENVSVVPARDGEERPFGTVQVAEIDYDDRWFSEADSAELTIDGTIGTAGDFAVLRLEEPVGLETGTLDYHDATAVSGPDATIEDVRIAGYPSVSLFHREGIPQDTMWTDDGTATVENVGTGTEILNTSPVGSGSGIEMATGHSGSPFFTEYRGEPTVVGVLSTGIDAGPLAQGPTLTADHLAMIENASRSWPNVSIGAPRISDRVEPGTAFDVTVPVTNDGRETGETAVDLTLPHGECEPATVEATVDAGTTVQHRSSCTVGPDAAGTNVTLTATAGGMNRTATIDVTERSLTVELGDLEEPYVPDYAGVRVPYVASNPTDSTVTDELTFLVDGEAAGSENVTLDPGEDSTATAIVDAEYELGGTIELGVATDSSRDGRTLNVTRVDPFTRCVDGVCGERVRNTTEEPYSPIVQVRSPAGDGSGALVEPGVVVTAAHVVSEGRVGADYDRVSARNVSVVPARNGDKKPFGSAQVAEIVYDDQWFPEADSAELNANGTIGTAGDFAVLRLETPVGLETGTFDYGRTTTVAGANGTIDDARIAGYPRVSSFRGGDFPEDTMWRDDGAVTVENAGTGTEILNSSAVRSGNGIEFMDGHSGSPFYTEYRGSPTVVGVLTNSVDEAPLTQGPTLTDAHLAMIENASRSWANVTTGAPQVPDGVTAGDPFEVSVGATNHGRTAGDVAVDVAVERGECETPTLEATVDAGATTDLRTTCTVDSDTVGSNVTIRANASTTHTVSVAVDRPSLDVEIDGHEPRPAGPDGLYRDLNGDGTVTVADANLLFQHRNSDPVQNNVAYFDFTGDGEVDLADVVALYRTANG